jgi:hypothetical protein
MRLWFRAAWREDSVRPRRSLRRGCPVRLQRQGACIERCHVRVSRVLGVGLARDCEAVASPQPRKRLCAPGADLASVPGRVRCHASCPVRRSGPSSNSGVREMFTLILTLIVSRP